MFVDDDGRISGNVTGNFFLTLFIDEASESTDINIMSIAHVGLHHGKECFYRCGNITFVYTSFLSDLIDDVCFGHGLVGLDFFLSGRQI